MNPVITCPVCGSNDYISLYPDTLGTDIAPYDYAFSPNHMRTYEIVRCQSCTHCFCIIPHNHLWENYQSVIDFEYLARQEAHILTAQKVVEVMARYIERGMLLDIGCATGDFLSVAQKKYSVEGLELSQWSSDIAKERGFNVHTCTIDKLSTDTKYDIITLWAVIEHFESPQDQLEKISKLLNPGGFVCIWTHDSNSWIARFMGKYWWHKTGQHIQLFSKRSLNLLFINAGFTPVAMERYPFTTNLKSMSKTFYRYNYVKLLSKLALENGLVKDTIITLRIPGEMFAIYQKKKV